MIHKALAVRPQLLLLLCILHFFTLKTLQQAIHICAMSY